MYLLAIHVSSLEKCLCKSLTQFLTGCLIIKRCSFYTFKCKSFIRHLFCKYIHLACCLSIFLAMPHGLQDHGSPDQGLNWVMWLHSMEWGEGNSPKL